MLNVTESAVCNGNLNVVHYNVIFSTLICTIQLLKLPLNYLSAELEIFSIWQSITFYRLSKYIINYNNQKKATILNWNLVETGWFFILHLTGEEIKCKS